jgi:antitoxin HicB
VADYPVVIRRLNADEGGGFIAEAPDLPGCIADGDSKVDALQNIESAIDEWIDEARRLGRTVPEPSSLVKFSGRWVQRVPRSLHMKLSQQAKREGVSLNHLAATLLAEGVGKKEEA